MNCTPVCSGSRSDVNRPVKVRVKATNLLVYSEYNFSLKKPLGTIKVKQM